MALPKPLANVPEAQIAEAQLRLPELIASLQPGEEVQIFSGDRTVARLIAELQQPRKPRKPGSAIAKAI